MHVSMTPHPETDMIEIRRGGEYAVSGRGILHLPVAARRACRLRAGDNVLLLVRSGDEVLYVFTAAALEAVVVAAVEALSARSS